jgi:DNA-binding transcriptional ArsR family regulator
MATASPPPGPRRDAVITPNGLPADPTRRKLLEALASGELRDADAYQAAGVEPLAGSYHAGALRLAGLVSVRRDGKRLFYALTAAGRMLVATARPGAR